MTSRLIERLDREISRCSHPEERECLKAERAGALARHGLMVEARFGLSGVRTQNLRMRSPRLSAWVAFVEGLIDHFDSMAPQAALKFERAQRLAMNAGDEPLQAQAWAWLATGSFNRSDIELMVQQLAQAVRLAPRQHNAAWARIGLVLADAYRFAGDNLRAQHWYNRARQAAGQDGDTSMMSAFLHNFAAMRSAEIGLEDAFSRADPEVARRALLEVDSIAHYDGTARAEALTAMVPVIRAQLLVVVGRFEEALQVYRAYGRQAGNEGMDHRLARFLADMAWCYFCLGQHDEARRGARLTETKLDTLTDADDHAAVHGRLAKVYAGLGEADVAAHHQVQADSAWATYEAERAVVRQALEAAFSRVM